MVLWLVLTWDGSDDETVIWVHIWQLARKQNFSHAFSRRPNHIESIVNVFPEQSRTMSLVILQSWFFFFFFFFYMKQKNRVESNISVVFSKGDRIGYKTITFVLLCYSTERQNLLENIFPAQWKTEFQSYFSQKLLESARDIYIYISLFFFFFNGYDIKIQKGIFLLYVLINFLFILHLTII